MTVSKIKKIKTLLKTPSFLNGQLRKWAEEECRLGNFYTFECSDHFKGETLADLNREVYRKEMTICQRKIDMFKRLLGKLK